MQSKAKTVAAYLKEVPAERKAALKHLCDLCRKLLTDFEETMDYGELSYNRNGEGEVGFASQKHFIGVYTLRVRTGVMNAHKHLLTGKGGAWAKALSVTPNPNGSISAWWRACCAPPGNQWDRSVEYNE